MTTTSSSPPPSPRGRRGYRTDSPRPALLADRKKAAEESAAAAARREARRKSLSETRARNARSKSKSSSSSTPTSTPPKPRTGRKRKEATPEEETDGGTDGETGGETGGGTGGETDGETDGEELDGPVSKRNKSSDEDDGVETPRKGTGSPRKETRPKNATQDSAPDVEHSPVDTAVLSSQIAVAVQSALASHPTSPPPVEIDYARITAAVAAAPLHLDSSRLASSVTAALDAALHPYLALLSPLMEFTQTCAGLKSTAEESANEHKAAVHSLVEHLRRKRGGIEKGGIEGEKGMKAGEAALKRGRKRSMDPDDVFEDGMSPDSEAGGGEFDGGDGE
ncbi:uncharacterized protein M421DRAFT_92036 [Didymella exigua CBS 183.55]|uniref:Uncharacterized protein n=1 Tax=Didymella exigua CBS 183.55 TaxID=1150837 RepID=A0A6A5RU71_9PLEO|nr:uncharacterized protein M421DRAFT_92036 [Didymella exigua CBS 183.55]KAF1928907.1 hypothetical protein M421DRAFT_92036 [Didymella exigua CBS 183.55]